MAEIVILSTSLIVFLLMGTIFIAGVLKIETGLTSFFTNEIDISNSYFPGQPSYGTMIGFILFAFSGIFVIKDGIKCHARLFRIGIIVGLIGLLAIIGYLVAVPFLYWNFSNISNSMALHTATLFTLLGMSLLMLPKEKNTVNIKTHIKIEDKFKASLIIFIFIPIVLMSLLIINNLRVHISKEAVNHLQSIAHIQEFRIKEVIEKYEVMAEGIASRTQLRKELQAVNSTGDIEAHNGQMQTILNDAIENMPAMKEVALFNKNDKLLLISPQKDDSIQYQSLFSQIKGRHFIGMKDGNGYTLYLVRPILLDEKTIGTFVFNFGPDLFQTVAGDYTGIGESGEMLLAFRNSDGDAEFLTEVRHPEARRVIKNTEVNVPIVKTLINKKSETFESSTDYRGVPVIAVTKYLEDLDWGLVVKMDKKEIFSEVQKTKNAVIVIGIIILFFSLMIANLISEKYTKENYVMDS